MKKTKYARVGEKVEIVVPKLFIRCGYPLTMSEILQKRCANVAIRARSAAMAAGLNWEDAWVRKNLERAVAADILKKEGFGGAGRLIFQEDFPELLGARGKVTARKMVYTGKYSPGFQSYTDYWTGESEWDPPSLYDTKAHCVYTLSIYHWHFDIVASKHRKWYWGDVQILAENVERGKFTPKGNQFLLSELLEDWIKVQEREDREIENVISKLDCFPSRQYNAI